MASDPAAVQPMIQATGLTFVYGEGAPVFRDFSWQVQTGEAWAVIGSSGCGKSTLLYLVAGLRQPSEGRLVVEGQPVTAAARQRRAGAAGLRAAALGHGVGERGAAHADGPILSAQRGESRVAAALSAARYFCRAGGALAGAAGHRRPAGQIPQPDQRRTTAAHRHRPQPPPAAQPAADG